MIFGYNPAEKSEKKSMESESCFRNQ